MVEQRESSQKLIKTANCSSFIQKDRKEDDSGNPKPQAPNP